MPKNNDILTNPYDLVKTIILKSKNNKGMIIEVYPNKVGYSDDFIIIKYKVVIPSCEYTETDIPLLNKFVMLRTYCSVNAKSRKEVIDTVSEFYKKNKKKLKLKVRVIPTKQDANRISYVMRELFTN